MYPRRSRLSRRGSTLPSAVRTERARDTQPGSSGQNAEDPFALPWDYGILAEGATPSVDFFNHGGSHKFSFPMATQEPQYNPSMVVSTAAIFGLDPGTHGEPSTQLPILSSGSTYSTSRFGYHPEPLVLEQPAGPAHYESLYPPLAVPDTSTLNASASTSARRSTHASSLYLLGTVSGIDVPAPHAHAEPSVQPPFLLPESSYNTPSSSYHYGRPVSEQPAGAAYHERPYSSEAASTASAFLPVSNASTSTSSDWSTHPSLSSSAGAVPGSEVLAPRVPTTAPEPTIPSILCRVVLPDGTLCGLAISLRPADAEKAVRAHMHERHRAYITHADEAHFNCPWLHCQCRCKKLLGKHAAHIEDVARHIYITHLNLTWPCDICYTAHWSSPFALKRHKKDSCTGLKPARCFWCMEEFLSLAALNLHIGLGGCPHAPALHQTPYPIPRA